MRVRTRFMDVVEAAEVAVVFGVDGKALLQRHSGHAALGGYYIHRALGHIHCAHFPHIVHCNNVEDGNILGHQKRIISASSLWHIVKQFAHIKRRVERDRELKK